MQIIVLCIGYICFICVAAALTWTAVYYREKDQTPPQRRGVQNFGTQTMGFQVFRQGKQRPAGQYWRMELLDTTNGDRIAKSFQGSVVLGRTQAQGETPDRCYVGQKQTISRRQCLIREFGPYLVVENLSHVNVTLYNNRFMERPYYLNRGDHLNMGGSDYVVTRLDCIA